MTAQFVALTINPADMTGAVPESYDTLSISASLAAPVPDPAGNVSYLPRPKQISLAGQSSIVVSLLSTDSVGPQPDAWTYTATFVTGGEQFSVTFFLRHADGAGQNLADLTPVPQGTGFTFQFDALGAAEAAQAAAEAASMPYTQSFPLANNTYRTVWEFSVTGQTDDPLPPFGLVTGSQTYDTVGYSPVQGPAFWFGYNPGQISDQTGPNGHGSVAFVCFADAGDTNNGAGGHGLELGATFKTPDGTSGETVAFEVVAVDDNTNTVSTTLRSGTGSSNGRTSSIQFQNADSSITYMAMGALVGDNVFIYRNVNFQGAQFTQSAAANVNWALTSTGGNAIFNITAQGSVQPAEIILTSASDYTEIILNGNPSSGAAAQIAFKRNSILKWTLTDSNAGNNFLLLNVSGQTQISFGTGNNAAPNYDNALTTMPTKVIVNGSLVVNGGGAALATTAVVGFLGVPLCAGIPTGVPTAQAGSVPLVYDTTDNKLYIYNGGWKSVQFA